MHIKKLLLILFILFLIVPYGHTSQKIMLVSGDNQIGISGHDVAGDLVVHVVSPLGEPLSHIPVSFVIIDQPAKAHSQSAVESTLRSVLVLTNEQGYAKTQLRLGHPQQGEVLVSASTKMTIGNPVVFRIVSKSQYWVLMLILGSVGGLGVFLFGITYLNRTLKKVAAKKLKGILIALTGSSFRGMLTGFFVTLLNQASSATTVLEVSLVSAGLLTFYQTMAVTMGAEIGSTITSQLVAFNITRYAVILTGAGFYLSVFSRSKKWKRIGEAIIGVGVIFLGMKFMYEIFLSLEYYIPFKQMIQNLQNPLVGIGIGLGVTIVVRSSGITSGVVIALALAHSITLYQAVPVLLGSQVGTSFTALFASLGRNREAQRTALWHTMHQFFGVLIIYPLLTVFSYNGKPFWIYAITWITSTLFLTHDLARQIAMSHTLAALINAFIFFPFLPVINKFLQVLVPSKDEEKPFGPMYLDEEFLETPTLALQQARKEIVREADIVLDMLNESLDIFKEQNLKLCESISLKEIHADMLRNAIVPYLTTIGQMDLTEEEIAHETQLLLITDDLESIGDIVEKNILPLIRKKLSNNLWFSDEGWQDIVELHTMVSRNFEKMVQVLKNNDREKAQLLVDAKAEVNIYQSELRKKHVSRLHSGIQESLETSSVHLDLIDQFKSINSRIITISFTLTGTI